jgi:uncharacterized membrane protein
MFQMKAKVVIQCPIDAVFAFLTDLERLPQWAVEVVESHQTSYGSPDAGRMHQGSSCPYLLSVAMGAGSRQSTIPSHNVQTMPTNAPTILNAGMINARMDTVPKSSPI